MSKLGDIFESFSCRRCGGEGKLTQYSNVIGGQCFKCGGSGRTFTDRGARDLAAYREAVAKATMRPVSTVKIGDAVRSRNMKKFVPVVAISEPRVSGWNDSEMKIPFYHVEITLNHEVWHDLSCPLSYKGATFSIGTDEEIGIHPGAENMPVVESFDSRRKAA